MCPRPKPSTIKLHVSKDEKPNSTKTYAWGFIRYLRCERVAVSKGYKHMGESVEERVQKALDELRPNLQADGGDVQLVAVENGVVKVKLKGACAGCPMSTMTVQWGIENFLKKKIPEITKVEAVQ